jgi:hypothetical protein
MFPLIFRLKCQEKPAGYLMILSSEKESVNRWEIIYLLIDKVLKCSLGF